MSARYLAGSLLFIALVCVSSSSIMAHDYVIPGGDTPEAPPEGDPNYPGGDPNNAEPEQNPSTDGEPVLLNTGQYTLKSQDLSLRGRRLSVALTRNYRSRSQYNSPFGYGWDMSYNIKVRKLNDPGVLVLLDGQNRKLEYRLDSDSDSNATVYIAPAGRYDYIQENTDGTFTMFQKHGDTVGFDINGNLAVIADRFGNAITFEYDPAGKLPLQGASNYFVGQSRGLVAMEFRLIRIIDDLGRETHLAYDSEGRLSTVTDFTARQWTYTYDPLTNDLLSVTGPAASQHPAGLTTQYTYDDRHRLLSVTDAKGQTYLTNHYNGQTRVDWQTYGEGQYSFAYDPNNRKTMVTDRKGFHKEVVHNATGNPISRTLFTKGFRPDDPNAYMTLSEYNQDMEVIRVVYPKGNSSNYDYDDMGNLLRVCKKGPDSSLHGPEVDANDLVATFTYEPMFNFIKTHTDPMGYTTTYTYDYESPSYGSDVGHLMKITYPTVSTPQGDETPVVEFSYNGLGQIETVTAPDGIVTLYEYYDDASDTSNYGRLRRLVSDYGAEPFCLNVTTEFRYDPLGNVVETTDAVGNTRRFIYDTLSQLTQSVAPSPFNYVTKYEYDKNKKLAQIDRQTDIPDQPWQTTGFTFDIYDNLETITDPLGHITGLDRDKNENVSIVTDAENNSSGNEYDERGLLWEATDALGNTTEYSYDENGNLKTIRDAKGNITAYDYDGFDRLMAITYPDESKENYTYDKNSNLLSKTNRKGQTTYYEYDTLNRITKRLPPDASPVTYTYDIAGRLIGVNNDGLVTLYKYDRLDRMIKTIYASGKQVVYAYDKLGRRTQLIYPDNTYVTYRHDEMNRLTEIVDSDDHVLAHYDYDALSRRTAASFANNSGFTRQYDTANRIKSIANSGTNWQRRIDYTYDKVGNRLRMQSDNTDMDTYTYDGKYQLTDVRYSNSKTVTYEYDALGNRVSVNDGSLLEYSVNSLNQYISVGTNAFTYDGNGNLTGDGKNAYAYNSQNQLVSVKTPTHTVVYEYDAVGRRSARTLDGQRTTYLYVGPHVIAEYDGVGDLLRKFIYGPRIDEPVVMMSGDDQYFYAFDVLGSVTALSDQSGHISEEVVYEAFGSPSHISDSGNPYYFTGRRYDKDIGLYYYRMRDYDPMTGRFLQTDPVGNVDGLNLYAYCNNNPVNWIDPYGLQKDEPDDYDGEMSDLGELAYSLGLDLIPFSSLFLGTEGQDFLPFSFTQETITQQMRNRKTPNKYTPSQDPFSRPINEPPRALPLGHGNPVQSGSTDSSRGFEGPLDQVSQN